MWLESPYRVKMLILYLYRAANLVCYKQNIDSVLSHSLTDRTQKKNITIAYDTVLTDEIG